MKTVPGHLELGYTAAVMRMVVVVGRQVLWEEEEEEDYWASARHNRMHDL